MSKNIDIKSIKDHVDAVVIENVDRLKQELFSFIEKECQLIRDRIAGPLPSYSTYTFDFYVEDFKNLIKSGKARKSPPWHINQFQSCLSGRVMFLTNGKLQVRLHNARRPLEVGLQPRMLGSATMTATITDTTGIKKNLKIGEITGNFNEDNIKMNSDCWGHEIGEIDCQKIIDEGLVEKPGYDRGAVLVRFTVTIPAE